MKFEFGPKVTSLLEKENEMGLEYSVRKNYVEENFRDELMDHYNDLTARLFDTSSDSLNSSSNDSRLVPSSKKFVDGNANGVKRLNFGQKLQIPGGVNSRQNINNQTVAPNSFNNNLQQQQNNGNFSRPPAPQLTPSTGAVGTNNQQRF